MWSSLFFLSAAVFSGCTPMPKGALIKDSKRTYPPGSIVSGASGQPVTFDTMIQDLSGVRIVFIGESHTDAAHHAVQLKILKALYPRVKGLQVGMEMFDAPYQTVLDAWTSGKLDEKTFLEKTHWYANWRYDFALYRDILEFIRDNRIPLYGLNIPFHLPAKIAIGGIESLSPEEKQHLPRSIDTSNAAHRAYVEKIFQNHRLPGRHNFDYFYLAQCVWEDAMAEQAVAHLNGKFMVVLAGNGHIIRKFGLPDRVLQRTRLPFKTVYPVASGDTAELSYGDYLWITPQKE